MEIFTKGNQAFTDKEFKTPLVCETHNTPMIIDSTIDIDPICTVCKHEEIEAEGDDENPWDETDPED